MGNFEEIKDHIKWEQTGNSLKITVSRDHWYKPNFLDHVLTLDEVKALHQACEKILSQQLTSS